METHNTAENPSAPKPKAGFRLRFPHLLKEEIGLGDVVKKVTTTVGLEPCGACQKRAQLLNDWMTFKP